MNGFQNNHNTSHYNNREHQNSAPRREDIPADHIQPTRNTEPEVNASQNLREPVLNSHNSNRVNWNADTYEVFHQDAKKGMAGEDLCRKYGIKKRDELKIRMYDCYATYRLEMVDIKFISDPSKGERPLSYPKVGKNGTLSISKQQLERVAKIDAPEGTKFKILPLQDGRKGFELIIAD